jgi:hypothetical protein
MSEGFIYSLNIPCASRPAWLASRSQRLRVVPDYVAMNSPKIGRPSLSVFWSCMTPARRLSFIC